MSLLFYEYAGCSTCKAARKWLLDSGKEIEIIPIVDRPPSWSQLLSYFEKSGLDPKKFFNTSGQVYRTENIAAKIAHMGTAEMAQLLASNGKLIKRPILVDGSKVLVGYKQEQYERHFR
jgi:arsenate reductase (glutaredoxin)